MVCLFWKTPGGENKKLARRLNMLKAVFYDRVFKGLREDMGETYSPSTGLNISETYPDDGYIITMSSGVMRNKEAVRSAIARIADDLGKGNITQEELDRARNPILNSMDRAQRDNGYWTSLLKDSQAKKDQSRQTYINQLYLFWHYYYQLRSLTLWDYASSRPIDADIDAILRQ